MLDAIISTNNGLFRLNTDLIHIMDGDFFGITRITRNYWIIADRTHRQLVLLDTETNKPIKKIRRGITDHTHQIDMYGNRLLITQTERNAIAVSVWNYQTMTLDAAQIHYPNGPASHGEEDFCHFNSVFGYKNKIYLVAHNLGDLTGKNSELFIMTPRFQLIEKRNIGQKNCHNFVPCKGSFLTCYSKLGAISNFQDTFFSNSEYFTRGLSINNDYIIFGMSKQEKNSERRNHESKVQVYNTEFHHLNTFAIPKSCINDIRQVKEDYGLSNYHNSRMSLL